MMTCLLPQFLLGNSDPAAWLPVSQRQEHSLLPPGAAALLLLALEQTSLRLNPLGRDYGSVPVLPQQPCRQRGRSRAGARGSPPGQGDAQSGLREQLPETPEQGERKGYAPRNELLLSSRLL